MATRRGSHALLDAFTAEGVEFIFGNPGSTETPLLDALVRFPDIRYVLGLHEGVAVTMAEGYSRATGRVGVANVHAAPGTCNALSSLFSAFTNRIPLLVIAGQQDSRFLVEQPFLSADLVRAAAPFTKWSYQLTCFEDIGKAVRRAFKLALQPPRGPVFLSLPRDVLDQDGQPHTVPFERYHAEQRPRPDPAQLRAAAALLRSAERPVILAGAEVYRDQGSESLRQLAELLGAPVWADPSVLSNRHPLFRGSVSSHNREILQSVSGADLVLAVGTRVFAPFAHSQQPLLDPSVRMIHVHDDPWELAKTYPTDVSIHASPRAALEDLADALRATSTSAESERMRERLEQQLEAGEQGARQIAQELEQQTSAPQTTVAHLVAAMGEALDPNTIIVDEGVRSSGYLKRYYPHLGPGTYYGDDSGRLGFGLPAALGIKVAQPDRRVLAFVGDGSANYAIQALWTATTYGIGIGVIILSNATYMAVKAHVHAYNGEAARSSEYIGSELPGLDFVNLARGYGVQAWRVSEPSLLADALRAASALSNPWLVQVDLDPNDLGHGLPKIASRSTLARLATSAPART